MSTGMAGKTLRRSRQGKSGVPGRLASTPNLPACLPAGGRVPLTRERQPEMCKKKELELSGIFMAIFMGLFIKQKIGGKAEKSNKKKICSHHQCLHFWLHPVPLLFQYIGCPIRTVESLRQILYGVLQSIGRAEKQFDCLSVVGPVHFLLGERAFQHR